MQGPLVVLKSSIPSKHFPIPHKEGAVPKSQNMQRVQQAKGQERGCLLFPGEAPQT